MPKLFFRKKKKKTKPSIKDALTPNSAFVAVPSTPPPVNTSNQKQKFTFSTRQPEISSPIPASTTSGRDSDLQQGYVGSYSLVGPGDAGEEDSEPEPGYATIRRDSPVNPSSQPLTETRSLKISNHQDPKTSREGVPLPVTPDRSSQRHEQEPNKSSTPPPLDKIHSTSELPSVTSGLSVHSDTSLNSSLISGSPTTQKQSLKSTGERQLNEEEVAALYSKVTKNKKAAVEKNDRSPSADLPPKAPRDSPTTPRSRRGKDRTDGITEGSGYLQKKTLSKTHSETPSNNITSRNSERKQRDKSSPRKTKYTHQTHVQQSQTQEEKYYQGEEERVVEYSDEDYLPSCEDSISVSENFYEEEEGSYCNSEHSPATYFRSRSATLPPHYPSTNDNSSHKTHSAKKPKPLSRPASSPHITTHSQIPVIHPPFMQSVTMPQQNSNGTYILSETHPDGSVHYFTATPVYSPTTHTPHTGVFQPMTPGTLPVAVNVPTVASVPMAQYAAGPIGLTESGYYSNITQPLTSPPTSQVQQHVIPQQLNTPSVQSPHSISKADVPTASIPETATSQMQSTGAKTVTPTSRMLSPSTRAMLQNDTPLTLSIHSPGDGSTPLKSQTPISNSSMSKETAGNKDTSSLQQSSTKLYSQMISQFKQNEMSLRARIRALENENNDLHRQNTILQDTSNSAEKLQAQVSSVIKDNVKFQEDIQQKGQQISSFKDQISQLKEEAANLLEENQMLLSQQQLKRLEQSEWETVADHAHSVMEENASLLRQQELQREQMRELKAEHQAIITQLKGEISKQKKEREMVERKLASLRESHIQLQDQFDSLTQESAKQVTMEEHQQALEEIQELLDELTAKNETDAKSQETQMRIFQKEKKEFVTRLTDAKAIIIQLEEDCTQLQKINRKSQEKIAELQYELEASRDREVVAHYQLTKAVAHAEKAMTERDTFAKIAKTQQKAIDRSAAQSERRSDRGSVAREGHNYFYKAQRKHYEGEIKHLRSLLARKQDHLSSVQKT